MLVFLKAPSLSSLAFSRNSGFVDLCTSARYRLWIGIGVNPRFCDMI